MKSLGEYARASKDQTAQWVSRVRSDLQLQGTPAAYTLFSIWPETSYGIALRSHLIVQMLAFILAVVLSIGRGLGGLGLVLAACVACLSLQTFEPFRSEVRVGKLQQHPRPRFGFRVDFGEAASSGE